VLTAEVIVSAGFYPKSFFTNPHFINNDEEEAMKTRAAVAFEKAKPLVHRF
jgi:hypothetical protein